MLAKYPDLSAVRVVEEIARGENGYPRPDLSPKSVDFPSDPGLIPHACEEALFQLIEGIRHLLEELDELLLVFLAKNGLPSRSSEWSFQ
ncbi:MAG: hypothetical protein ABSF26_00120 [Thermoguttaceae bacterium]